ncbi:CHC2 zinc finger domain-containing protein [Roseibium album]|uniref:CHC2 zinc finger domain-containing protein n=1 Tax=Roseibium album TaxID=311410 RepID=UPI00391C1C7F
MKRFTEAEKQRVKERNPISSVIGKYVEWDRRKTQPSKGDFWACCPFHAEKRPSFHCDDRRGHYKCFGCGASGDQIKFLMELHSIPFVEAMEQLGGEAELEPLSPERLAADKAAREKRQKQWEEDQRKDEHARLEVAKELWGEARLIEGTIAEDYLRNRVKGLTGALPDVLRFHPKAFLSRGEYHSALVALVQGVDGQQVGTWRIFLDAKGQNLRDADGQKIKKGLGPCGGGAVRLHPPENGSHIAVCEGIETAFGVHLLTGSPVWACRTANGLSGFDIPFEIDRLSIYPDADKWKWQSDKAKWLDPTGRREALKLAEKAVASHITVTMQQEPRPGRDFLDLSNREAERREVAA